jgi:hypothetical protein
MTRVFEKTSMIWENYARIRPLPQACRPDCWMGAIGLILYLIEYAIGLRADVQPGLNCHRNRAGL